MKSPISFLKLLSNEISVGGHLGSIASRCSGKEPALLPRRHSSSRGGMQTRHERAAEIQPFILPRVNFCSFLFSLANHSDAPWCDIRPTHAGFKHVKTKFESRKKEKWENGLCVKGRNEPANIM